MADLNNVKTGNTSSNEILFYSYYSPKANESIIFKSIIPKDNTKVWNSVYGEWQVNDDWEVEIIDTKRIAIKKFRIDTWGLRKIWKKNSENSTDPADYNEFYKFKVKATGLDYVHNNVVYQEDSNGNKTYGFVKAYAGTGGYNVYWYPGQFTSGYSIQGLGIQSSTGYQASLNEIEDSFQMGKHPWDIGTMTHITDGICTGGTGDASYRSTTIGLFGGYQTATEWHEYTKSGYKGNAYKVYDISNHPIIIDLDVQDTTKAIDVSSIECWDIFVGSTNAYHKDKTRENCWKKYGIMFPENYNLIPSGLTLSNTSYIKWVASNKFVISRIPSEGLNITRVSTVKNTESTTPSYQGFSIKITNKASNITAKFKRTFTNVSNTPGGTPINYNVEYNLENGTTDIPAYSQKMFLIDRTSEAVLTEFNMSFEGEGTCNILVELIPIYKDNGYNSINVNSWNILPKLILPEVTDKLSDMSKTLWNSKIENTEFWDDIKQWYENNYTDIALLQHGIFRKSNIDEIKLRFNSIWGDGTVDTYMWSSKPFSDSSIKKITLESINGCKFSVGNSLFSRCYDLETIELITYEGNRDFMVGATDFSGMFERCSKLKTYPSNLIHYNVNRSHAFDQGIPCSLTNYMFDYCDIEEIPMYGNDRYAEANTMVLHRSAAQTFNTGSSLKYIGPVINMILVRPSSGCYNIFNCSGLEDARIKNLNHGSWSFDGENRGVYHGNLESLNAESISYLFDNLMDLTTCNPEVHEAKIDKCFISWSTSYASTWDTEFWTSRVAVRYFETRDRRGTEIVSTNQTFTDMRIEVSGLQEGDVLSFGEVEITENGTHKLTKSNTDWEAFKLTGDINDTTNIVKVIIENGLDYTNPLVSTANLYCPSTWEDKITDSMINTANTKGWKIYIGGLEVQSN